jgi:chorismate synthase
MTTFWNTTLLVTAKVNDRSAFDGGQSQSAGPRICSLAVKRTSSIRLLRLSVDLGGKPVIVETHSRHDRCVGTRATPIAEAIGGRTVARRGLSR